MDLNISPSKCGDNLITVAPPSAVTTAGSAVNQNQQNSSGKQPTIVNTTASNGKIISRSSTNGSNSTITTEGGGGTTAVTSSKQISSNCSKNSTYEKRKSKARHTASAPSGNPVYPRDLDAWLENCLKDAVAPPLSSSSEFLDYNPSSFNINGSNKKIIQTTSGIGPNVFLKNCQKTAPDISPCFTATNNQINWNKVLKNSNDLEADINVEFASLPPTVNMGTYTDNNMDINGPNRSFRFSDPCLIAPSDNESKISGRNTPDPRSLDNQIGSNKFLSALLEQLNLLRETNTKIYRNLHETKVELEALKHASNLGLRYRRDSLSGLSTHSQPMGFGLGTHSPAPTYHSGMYTPGMMTDVIREVKEAARVREEALLNRVKAMVEERSWSMGEGNLRLMRDMEEMKIQLQHLKADNKEVHKRISQLETENRYMRTILGSLLNNRTSEIINENEIYRSTPILRKSHQDMGRIKRNGFNLNYGTINQEEGFTVINPNIQKSMNLDTGKLNQTNIDRRSTYETIESHINSNQNGTVGLRTDNLYATSTDNEQLASNNEGAQHILQMEKDTMELRRELQEALASKKRAENQIIALEDMVQRLQIKNTTSYHQGHHNHHHNQHHITGTISTSSTVSSNDNNFILSPTNRTTISGDLSQNCSPRSINNMNPLSTQIQGLGNGGTVSGGGNTGGNGANSSNTSSKHGLTGLITDL